VAFTRRQAVVIQVLADADRPLRAREIHTIAQKLAGTPLAWNTVKDCLHQNARRPDSPIERVSHGRYRRAKD
jgi:Fe2+ or Zn2+ uptake regulation protein